MFNMKIKLGKQFVKKEESVEDASAATQRGPVIPLAYTNGSNGAAASGAAGVQPAPGPGALGKPSITGNLGAPGGAPKPLKLKMPSGPIPGLNGQLPGPAQGPKPAQLKVKQLKRPGGPLNLGPPPAAGVPGGPAHVPKKFKLGTMGAPKLKLKTTGTLNLAGAAIHHPVPQPLGTAQLPPRMPGMGVPGPKKRGRKRKDDPESLANRQARLVDEVTYKIASPPPRQHSLRQSTSHATLGGPMGEPGRVTATPLGPLGLDFIEPMPPGGGPGLMEGVPYIPEDFPLPDFPLTPPTKEELARLLAKVWEKDTHGLFHKPVTEEVAPGYSEVIKNPMDLSTMKGKLETGAYPGWAEFWEDMGLMFNNALTFNAPHDKIHQYAAKLRKTAAQLLTKARAPSKSGGANAHKRAAAAKKAATAKAERDAAARQARAEQKAAQEAKVLKRAGVAGDGDDLEARATYKSVASNPIISIWGGLAGGLSGQGAAWGYGRPTLKPSNPIPSAEGYAASIMRFASGLTGRARDLVMARIEAAKSAAENVVPPEKPQPAPVQQPKGGKGGSKAKQQQQQAQQQQQQQQQQAAQHAARMQAQKQVATGAPQLQTGMQGAPIMGVLPPVAPLAGVPPAAGGVPMVRPNAASMAAHNAKMLATQTQAQVAPGGMTLPTTMPMSMPMASFPPPALPGMPPPMQLPNFTFPGMQQQQRPVQGMAMPPGMGQFPQFPQQMGQQQQQQQQQYPQMQQLSNIPQQMGLHNGQQLLFQPPPQ